VIHVTTQARALLWGEVASQVVGDAPFDSQEPASAGRVPMPETLGEWLLKEKTVSACALARVRS
jgi:hypothetical protein